MSEQILNIKKTTLTISSSVGSFFFLTPVNEIQSKTHPKHRVSFTVMKQALHFTVQSHMLANKSTIVRSEYLIVPSI